MLLLAPATGRVRRCSCRLIRCNRRQKGTQYALGSNRQQRQAHHARDGLNRPVEAWTQCDRVRGMDASAARSVGDGRHAVHVCDAPELLWQCSAAAMAPHSDCACRGSAWLRSGLGLLLAASACLYSCPLHVPAQQCECADSCRLQHTFTLARLHPCKPHRQSMPVATTYPLGVALPLTLLLCSD